MTGLALRLVAVACLALVARKCWRFRPAWWSRRGGLGSLMALVALSAVVLVAVEVRPLPRDLGGIHVRVGPACIGVVGCLRDGESTPTGDPRSEFETAWSRPVKGWVAYVGLSRGLQPYDPGYVEPR